MSLATLITRGKVMLARMAARTLLQVTGLDNETFNNVELLLPPGYVASPLAGSDVILLQTNGLRSHLVALCGDNTADTVANLTPGEVGLARGPRSVILRVSGIVLTDPQKIVLQTPELYWSPDGQTMHKLATDTHTHPGVQTGNGATQAPNASSGMVSG